MRVERSVGGSRSNGPEEEFTVAKLDSLVKPSDLIVGLLMGSSIHRYSLLCLSLQMAISHQSLSLLFSQ